MARTIEVDGARIEYEEHGPASGDAVLLCLPGWCVDRGFFTQLATHLASHRRVVLLDWRGHGASSAPAGDFGHAELLEDALAVIEASGAKSVIPIAQAHGGWVAIELAKRLGARVPGVVALSWLVLEPPPPFLGVLDALVDPARWEGARDRLFAMWTDGAPADVAERVRRGMGAYGFEMWARAARCIGTEYARHASALRAVAALPGPPRVLHLFSQPRDPAFLDAQQGFAREHPWFGVQRLDATSHFPALEAPAATAAAIEGWLTG